MLYIPEKYENDYDVDDYDDVENYDICDSEDCFVDNDDTYEDILPISSETPVNSSDYIDTLDNIHKINENTDDDNDEIIGDLADELDETLLEKELPIDHTQKNSSDEVDYDEDDYDEDD